MKKSLLFISLLTASLIVMTACGNTSSEATATDTSDQATTQVEDIEKEEIDDNEEVESDVDGAQVSCKKEQRKLKRILMKRA